MSKTRTPERIVVADVCRELERIAPPGLAKEWDNVGLIVGDLSAHVSSLLLTIDLTEAVLNEAQRAGATMAMAYHPPIFRPIGRVTREAAPVVWLAAKAGLAVYSPHTALDCPAGGTNDVLAVAIGIENAIPLEPALSAGECKVAVYVPPDDVSAVASAAFGAGAGRIGNYTHCSFRSVGTGSFWGQEGARPAIGQAGRLEEVEELRLEVIAPRDRLAGVLSAIRAAHSYETPAIDVYPLEGLPSDSGIGRIGHLAKPISVAALVDRLKRVTGLSKVLLAGEMKKRVTTAACGAGSCGSLFQAAAEAGADVYVTGEIRHHDALAAVAAGLTVICLGHSNSERLVLPPLARRIRKALPGLKVMISKEDRDPLAVV